MEDQLGKSFERWPLRQWDYPQLTLAGWYFDPGFQAARLDWRQAEAELAAAGGVADTVASDYAPILIERPPGLSTIKVTPSTETMPSRTGKLLASYPETGRRAGHAMQTNERLLEAWRQAKAARFRLEAVAWQLRAGVRSNLLNYVVVQRGETLLEPLEAAYVDLEKSAELRAAAGATAYVDLATLRLHLAQTRLVLIRARLEKMNAREQLAHSLSLPVNALFDVEVEYDLLRSTDRDWTIQDLRWQALHHRADMAKALMDYAVAETAVRAALGKKLRRLDLPPGSEWDFEHKRWDIRLDSWLSEADRGSRAVAQAESLRVAAAAHLLKLQSEIIDELERDAAVYRATTEEVADVDALVSAVAQEYANAQERYKAGIAAAPELLLAKSQLMAASVARLEAQLKVQTALGSLEDALQLPAQRIGGTGRLTDLRFLSEFQ